MFVEKWRTLPECGTTGSTHSWALVAPILAERFSEESPGRTRDAFAAVVMSFIADVVRDGGLER